MLLVSRSCAVGRTLGAEEFARDVERLAAHQDDLLPVEQLLGHDAGQAAEEMALAIDDHLVTGTDIRQPNERRWRKRSNFVGIAPLFQTCRAPESRNARERVDRLTTGSKVDMMIYCRAKGSVMEERDEEWDSSRWWERWLLNSGA